MSIYPARSIQLFTFSLDVGAFRSPIQVLKLLSVTNSIHIFEVIDRESPTTGVWVLDWVIYNSIINEISSIAREVDQGASSRL